MWGIFSEFYLVWIDLYQIVDTGDKDSTYYKTLLAGMKRDFTAELEKIKGHLTKERFRYIIENETMNLMLIIQEVQGLFILCIKRT